MVRWGMVIDLSKCVGCQTCTVACKLDNGTPPDIFWRFVKDVEVGAYPNVTRFFLPLHCMHCKKPPCLTVCPTTATQRRGDGIVYIDYDKCIGCGYCILACPYEARWLLKGKKGFFNDGLTQPEKLSPLADKVGVCTKCDFCMDRIDYGLANNLVPGRDPDATPVCVNSCIARALFFGDLDDPENEVSYMIRQKRAFRLLTAMDTEPSVYYVW
ncbi:MAG: 4Fe-4S dicluster domain-containing protein [Candidatus Caldarchaeum sp.]